MKNKLVIAAIVAIVGITALVGMSNKPRAEVTSEPTPTLSAQEQALLDTPHPISEEALKAIESDVIAAWCRTHPNEPDKTLCP